MGKIGMHIENFLILLTLLTFTIGILFVNLAKDRLIGLSMILILLSAAFSISTAIFILRAEGKKPLAKCFWIAVTLSPTIFSVCYFAFVIAVAKD
jgi:hypothetical protein